MHIYKEEECEGNVTYLKKTLALLKWMPDPVRREEKLRTAT
jgi:hypothetical protein